MLLFHILCLLLKESVFNDILVIVLVADDDDGNNSLLKFFKDCAYGIFYKTSVDPM
jgi:hypothetical protein